MKYLTNLALLLSLGGCVTLSGDYDVSAKDASGKAQGYTIATQGRGIYTARNALCSAYPGAVVTIVDSHSGKELGSESPYRCR
ncbi:hypothetical protein [Pseudomonas abieticivorans]|uniref:hypothetical protein n=1 Tax=Pseudomonas abieticivorans TaxID=2931382 RepID=UPI0020BF4ABB|nr:hypothetical protein [Pseudomonas sp. PIA16]